MSDNETKSEREIRPPNRLPDSLAYWTACAEGKLLVKRCQQCGQAHWYPRVLCPYCLGDSDWEDAGVEGVVYTYSVTRRAGPHPYCIAYVDLPQGVRMMTNIVDCDLEQVRIGSRVRLVFKAATDGTSIPMFTLAS